MIWEGVEGRAGVRRKETVTLHQPSVTPVLGLGHQRQMMPHPLHQQEVMTTVSVNCQSL